MINIIGGFMHNILENKKLKYALMCTCVVVAFIFINKGFDLTDTGYIMNSYKFVFSNPESINFSIIFTSIIGNLITNIFSFFGIPSYLGLKIVSSVLSLIGIFIVIKLLKQYFNENLLLIGSIISLLLVRNHIITLMYTNLTAIISIIIVFFLVKGLINNNKFYIFISGILIGLNTFIRLPNIVQVILIISIIYYSYICKNKKILKKVCIFFLGIITSILCSILLISVIFGINNFMDMIKIYLGEAIHSNDAHSIMDSIKINLNQGLNGLFWIILFGTIAFVLDFKLKSKIIFKKRIYIIAIMLPLIFVVLKMFGADGIKFIDKIYLIFYGLYQPFTIVVAFYIVMTFYYCFISDDFCKEVKLILFTSMLTTISAPMGSNQGFAILYQSFYLQSPLVIIMLEKILNNREKNSIKSNVSLRKATIIFLLSYFICMLIISSTQYIYRDKNPLLLTASIDNKELKGIKTTYSRANEINTLLNYIDKYKDSSKKLITYGSIPLLSYVLDMPPFFDGFNGWLEMDQLSLDSMQNSLKESEINGEYPLIIISNVGMNNSEWPNGNTREIMNNIKKEDKKYELIINYAEKNKYNLVYENNAFKVYSNE